jgi:predicted secreted protein
VPGQGGTETFTFKASGPGTTTIVLTYARSFDPTDNPTVHEYTLVVSP